MNITVKALKCENISLQRRYAITAALWDEEVGAWLYFDIINNIKRNYFYLTNILSPLWTGCYEKKQNWLLRNKGTRLFYQEKNTEDWWGYTNQPQGIRRRMGSAKCMAPTSIHSSYGLDSTGNKDAQIMASKIAYKWLCKNYVPYYNNTKMYKK